MEGLTPECFSIESNLPRLARRSKLREIRPERDSSPDLPEFPVRAGRCILPTVTSFTFHHRVTENTEKKMMRDLVDFLQF